MLWNLTFLTSDANKARDRLLRATTSICPHHETADYQVGWQRCYPHPLRLCGQLSCRAKRCWHHNQRLIFLRTLHRLTPHVPRPVHRPYEDSTYDVDLLYDKFAKYETRRKLADLVAGKADKTTDDSLALFGQQASSSSSKKKKRKERKGKDHNNVTCYGCGKKGHIQRKYPDGEKKDEKHDEKEDKRDDKSKPAKGNEEASSSKAPSGAVYTAVSRNALSSTGGLLNIDSGASDHFIPSRGDLGACKKFAKYQQLAVERSTLMVLGPCEWQRQPTV